MTTWSLTLTTRTPSRTPSVPLSFGVVCLPRMMCLTCLTYLWRAAASSTRDATSATAAKKKPAVVSWQVGSREARRAFYCKWHIVKSFEVYASAPRSTVRPAMMMSSPRRSSSASASSRRVRCSLLLPAAARRWRRAAAVVERSSSGRRGGGRRRRRPGTPKQECEVCNGISIPGAGSGSRRREARAPLGLVPFSAFWLRSSVVSVLISVKTGNPSNAWVYFHMYF